MPNAEKIGSFMSFRAVYMQKSAITPNCDSLSSFRDLENEVMVKNT